MAVQHISHIEITPGVRGGKPRIAGRRITVADIAQWHVHADWSARRIAEEFDLTPGQVYAALSYYYDHQQEIEQSIRDEEDFAEEFRKQNPSPLQDKFQDKDS
jgi:uncharacterized protein (DUF433 family)